MKFMMIVKANAESEAGVMPSDELFEAMNQYNEKLVKAGILVEAAGLHPSSKGARVYYNGDKRTVVDGPFTESKELIAGFWIINVTSRQEAIDWALKIPNPHGEGVENHVELRQFFGLEDFGDSEAAAHARELEKEWQAQKG